MVVNEGQTWILSATYTYWLGAIIITAAPSQLATMPRSLIFGIVKVKMLSFECFWLIQATPVIAVFWLLLKWIQKGRIMKKTCKKSIPERVSKAPKERRSFERNQIQRKVLFRSLTLMVFLWRDQCQVVWMGIPWQHLSFTEKNHFPFLLIIRT